jgi:hypothetical protein
LKSSNGALVEVTVIGYPPPLAPLGASGVALAVSVKSASAPTISASAAPVS